MKKGKLIGYTALSLVAILLAGFILWWVLVYYYGPNKEVHNTFELDTISTIDGSQSDYVIKVNYFSNENNNGVEAIEIVFNSFMDERNDRIYQQGIQIVADEGKNIGFEYKNNTNSYVKDYSWYEFFTGWHERGHEFGTFAPVNSTVSYYTSFDNFYTVEGSTKTFVDDGFKITFTDDQDVTENYLLKFNGHVFDNAIKKDADKKTSAKNYVSMRYWNPIARDFDIFQYHDYDINFFAMKILQSVHDISNGAHHATLVKLEDMFKYYILNSSNVYEEISSATNAKVSVLNSTFAAIYVEKTADGLRRSSDSIFGLVNHSNGFNVGNSDEPISDDYFVGQNLITLNENAFDIVVAYGNRFLLKLKDSFIGLLSSYKTTPISIEINLDHTNTVAGVNHFDGFLTDLSSYTIFEIYTLQTVNGETVRTEVTT